jgi:pyridoxamine 5'-phosphate oxidase
LSNEFSRDLRIIRREHEDVGVDAGDLLDDPLAQFERWMQEAIDAGVHLPNAMTVATVGQDGRPSARITLLKGVDEEGFVFFSNYDSRKGGQLQGNSNAAFVFYWGDLGRQVRVEGQVERVSESESADYFATRSRGSQLGAWASPQSQVIADRAELEALVASVEERFAGDDIPLPPHWGGFRLRPTMVEFWVGRRSRLHDRIRYTKRQGGEWLRERLAP